MPSCIFCQKQDDIRDMKIYDTCDVAEGQPCGPCTEYSELEAQIEETRRNLEQQLGRRREIRENINRVHNRMLVRVPREITAYIFELAVSVENSSSDQVVALRDGEMYTPLRLGKVCGAWRDIAWSMPQLWNFMSARIRTIKDLPSRLELAKQWLERSGDYLPLSIHFRVNETYDVDNWDLDEFIPFMELLNTYAHRWKDLCGFCPPSLIEHLSAEVQGAPILQRLQLSANNLSEDMIFDLGCKRLPQPRWVRLDTVLGQHVKIDWSQVTRFDTDCPWGIQFLTLLPHLPKLKELRLYDVIGQLDAQYNPVAHFSLQSLYFNCSLVSRWADRNHLYDLLDFFIFPSLQRLTVNLMQSVELLDKIVSFLQRSSCKLVSMSLSYSPTNARQSFLNLLEFADSIEELEISIPTSSDDSILEALRYRIRSDDRPSRSGPFPFSRLQCLKYVAPDSSKIPWNLLLLIFDLSWTGNRPPWRKLSVVCYPESTLPKSYFVRHRGLDKRIIEEFIKLVDGGIELFLPRKINKDDLLDLLKPQPMF